ncbi:hypothetical protein [Pleomorphovibrio marinus]|uniref:hypothetical protein n=1 Tax=Pleomorphovibrio marinus TaxID=2164132 RepID=UPI001300B371|nr:hypothetical protein [Pleomorphovibrio marinus]
MPLFTRKIALLVCYLCFNAGLSYSMHFCEGDFKHFNFFASSEGCCPGETEMPDCCEDVSHLEVPNGEEFQPNQVCLSLSDLTFHPSILFEKNIQLNWSIAEKLGFSVHAPPLIPTQTSLFLIHQVWLI